MSDLAIEVQQVPLSASAAVAILGLKGSLDAHTLPIFENQLTAMKGVGLKRFVLDFAVLKFISSSGFGAIIALCDDVKDGGGVCLVKVPSKQKEFFDMIGMSELVRFCETRDEALGHFATGS